jgi:endonuclease YncB( thermonuclease family)
MTNTKILALVIVGICICAGVAAFYLTGEETQHVVPHVIENLEAFYITDSNAILKVDYNTENQWTDTKIRFGYREDSGTWNYADWREVSENGVLYENIGGLASSTRYEFKTILQHDSEEITSPVSEFETYTAPLNYEAYGTVDYAVDGDTVKVNLTWVNPSTIGVFTGSGQSMRFAGGIDAPETWTTPPEPGSYEAKEFIRDNFCSWSTEVWLDLDNLSDNPYHDTHGRLLGVIYVKKDGKWVNVNAELLRWGMEAYPNNDWDEYTYYTSEFNMYEWPPYDNDYPYVL